MGLPRKSGIISKTKTQKAEADFVIHEHITVEITCYISGNKLQTEPDFQLIYGRNFKRLKPELGWEV